MYSIVPIVIVYLIVGLAVAPLANQTPAGRALHLLLFPIQAMLLEFPRWWNQPVNQPLDTPAGCLLSIVAFILMLCWWVLVGAALM